MNLFDDMARLTAERTPFVVATVVASKGSSPQKPGAKLLVLADGTLRGTIGGGAIEHQVVQAARALLQDPEGSSQLYEAHLTHDLGMCCGGSMSVFLEKVAPSERLLLFGAGHVGKALCAAARAVGFQVTVVDARPDWLTAERFPDAERRIADPREVAASLPLDVQTYACVMTHDHQLDQEIVGALLRRPLCYLGLIGSLRKAERCRTRLEGEGFGADEIARLRSPMGVAIGAVSAEEIALSIAAELVAVRHGVQAPLEQKTPKRRASEGS